VKPSSSVPSIVYLRDTVRGRVILPDDTGYDAARQVFSGGFDPRPAVIARPADAGDVAHIIAFARETGLPLAVRSGGHSGAGHGTVDGGVVIDVRDLRAFEIDAPDRTVWAGAGLSAADYSRAANAHGLATGFGDTGSVGIGGLTLGGGIGYLTRKYGLTIDSVLAAEIVTADGRTLHVDEQSHPDLFWAIRGGGGNFGVVTRFKYRLHPVDHVVGGVLVLPADPDVIVRVTQASAAAPEELSVIINVMSAPPMPFLPAEIHGQIVTMMLVCYAGEAEAGAAAIAPFRAAATPLADLVRPIRYPEMFPPDDPSFHPTAAAKTMFIDHVDRPVAETILAFLRRSDASLRVAQIRVLGGAMARVANDATAFAHRQSRILVNVAAFYQGPEDRPVREAWVQQFASAIDQGDRGAYVGFLLDEGEARVRAAYPGATWDRLAAVKAKYDPDNVFKRNQNVGTPLRGELGT
jgi:FAD binding domain-containing protein/berberine-like enzyme